MSTVQMKFKILDDPDKKIALLKRGLRNRILRKAVRAGAALVRKDAKAGAPHLTGALASSISVKIGTARKSGAIYGVIGPRSDYVKKIKARSGLNKKGKRIGSARLAATIKPSKYAHFLEYGTIHARAHPFLRPAWDGGKAGYVEAMRKVIEAEMQRADAR